MSRRRTHLAAQRDGMSQQTHTERSTENESFMGMEHPMTEPIQSSRRTMLAALAAVAPSLSTVLTPTRVLAQGAIDRLASWNDGPRKRVALADGERAA